LIVSFDFFFLLFISFRLQSIHSSIQHPLLYHLTFSLVCEGIKWSEINDLKQVERKWISPSLNDIVDLSWSPDSSYIIIGALEQKVLSMFCGPLTPLFYPFFSFRFSLFFCALRLFVSFIA
jgi:hypothetical protein